MMSSGFVIAFKLINTIEPSLLWNEETWSVPVIMFFIINMLKEMRQQLKVMIIVHKR